MRSSLPMSAYRHQAAKICLAAPMLFGGQDVHVLAMCAEQMMLRALRVRYDFVVLCVEEGIDDVIIQLILSNQGEHGTDRMLAQWWWQVDSDRLLWLLRSGVAVADTSVAELHRLGLFGQPGFGRASATYDMFYPSEVDAFLADRDFARRELMSFQDKLKREAAINEAQS